MTSPVLVARESLDISLRFKSEVVLLAGITCDPFWRLLASAKGQGEAQPQYEFAGNRMHKRSAEAGRNEFAAQARRPCQARTKPATEGER